MFGRRRRRFFAAHCSHFFRASCSKWKFFGKPMPGWKVRNILRANFFSRLIWYGLQRVLELKYEMKESSKGKKQKKAMWWRFSWCWFRDEENKNSKYMSVQFVGGWGMKKWWFLNGMTKNIPMHAWKHSHKHSLIYIQMCTPHTHQIRLLVVVSAYPRHPRSVCIHRDAFYTKLKRGRACRIYFTAL